MPSRTLVLPLASAALIAVLPCSGSAQPATPFAQAIQQLTPGTDVKVVDAAGRPITGRVEQVDADAIVVATRGSTFRLTEEEVRTLSTRHADSVVEGLLIGIGIGIAGGAATGAALSKHYNDDYIEDRDVWLGVIGGGLAGVAIGGLWDSAMREEKEVYRRSATVALAPLTNARGGRGVLVQMRW